MDLKLSAFDTYFEQQEQSGRNGDVKALYVKKWFNTNMLWCEIDDDADKACLVKPFDEYLEA